MLLLEPLVPSLLQQLNTQLQHVPLLVQPGGTGLLTEPVEGVEDSFHD